MATRTEPDLDVLTRRFKALSDERRLRIVDRLRSGERCVCELTDAIGGGQSLLSFHLKTLKGAGLITDRRDGRWVYYALDGDALRELETFIGVLGERVPETRWAPACC